jgi:Fic family protein
VQKRKSQRNIIKKKDNIAYNLLKKGLNNRQADLLGYLYLKENKNITLNLYAEKHKIVRQTASKDLNELIKIGLLQEDKSTKPYTYTVKSRKIIEEFIN